MRKVKWIFFAYLAVCLLVMVGIGVSFAITRTRNPNTNYAAYGGDVKTLDPAEISDVPSSELAGNVFECLYNYAYGVQPYTLVPELAKGKPIISADGKTWMIHIKPGVHFYDPQKAIWPDGVGPEVTAADFVYSWKRVCNFHLGITANYAQVFQGRVLGIDDWYNYTQSRKTAADINWKRPVPGLTALNRYTLRIKLVAPFPQLQFNLAMMPTTVVCRAIVEHWGSHFRDHPVGTGPYMIEQRLRDQRIVYLANPIYRGGPNVASGTKLTDAQRLPHVKRVQLNCFQEPLPPWFLFLQGQLDASGIPKDTFGQAIKVAAGTLTRALKKQGIKLVKSPAPEVAYIGFNMDDPIVGKNKPLRQAMSMAFDREKFIQIYLNGRGVPANGPIPPGFPTYDAKRVDPYCVFDLDAAREKIKEAEKINGGPLPPLHILFGGTSTDVTQEADFLVTQMRQIGLTLLPDYKPFNMFLPMIDRKQEQIFALGWVADYPDEQDFWQLFYSKNAGPGGLNSCNYSNAEFDRLFEKTAGMKQGPQRKALYLKMQQLVLEDCPWIFELYPLDYSLYHHWEGSPKLTDYGYGFKQYLKIDFAERAAWLKNH